MGTMGQELVTMDEIEQERLENEKIEDFWLSMYAAKTYQQECVGLGLFAV
jgi:hypothetical protein